MFKNRHFQVKFVKDTEATTPDTQNPAIDIDAIATHAKAFVKDSAVLVVGVIAATVILTTASKIIVTASEEAIKSH